MDDIIKKTPELSSETKELMQKAEKVYSENFDNYAWFGRCIFLSWYCDKGTCDFCFRSTQKHKIKHIETARRSLASVLAEAAMIRGLSWRLEFLTGGYGIYPFPEIVEICKLCSDVLGEKLWVNLGVLEENQLKELKPYVGGIVSSLETLNPKLHDKVCPDKPIEPYIEMIENAKKLGFKQSFTLVIGLGEKREDFSYVKEMIDKYGFERVTVYALRPVFGTPYKKGPSTEDMVWWISNIRINFPKIEIIAGTAIYRIPEISLLLRAGANAFTKLPATKMFNTEDARFAEEEVKKAGRRFISSFTSDDIENHSDWKKIIDISDLSEDKKSDLKIKLGQYLKSMEKKK
ncbi:MAG: radical SAM protein [Candidatus Woesearchaeota archaeon]